MNVRLPSLLLLAGMIAPSANLAAAPQSCPVEVTHDITYCQVAQDPSPERHRLDVYHPKGKEGCPVLFFLHGGAWMIGKKDNYFGIYGYGTIARCLAERGLVVVLPNYRLSPTVRHPEHIKDVARAFDWTCANVAQFGGDPKRIVIAGHSAGGHLATLLATDPTYLKEVGRSQQDIRGVIGISGVYRVYGWDVNIRLHEGIATARADFRLFANVFGDDPEVARQASPVHHVSPGLPPFLLINAAFDYPLLCEMAGELASALKKNQCEVETRTFQWRTHDTVLFDILRQGVDADTADLMMRFIERCIGH